MIEKIESDEKFEANTSLLCDWCEFKPICRQWSHLYVIREKPENEYMDDPGVKLVERYAELKAKEKQVTLDIYAELEKIEEALIAFSEKEGVETVFGPRHKIRIKDTERYSFPSKNSSDRKQLVQTLKDLGKWDEVVQLDTAALNKIIQEKQWDSKSLDILEQYIRLEKSRRLYLSKIKNAS